MSAFSAWKNVLFALFLREWQSKFNDKFGLSWAFVEPFIFVFFLAYFRSMLKEGDVYGVPIFVFMLVGLVFVQTFLQIINGTSNALKKGKPLYAFRQVHPIAPVLVSAFIELSIKLGVIGLSSVALYLLQIDVQIDNLLLAISVYAMLWLFSASLALLFGIAATFVPEADKIKAMLARPMFFISGIFFSLKDIPEKYWVYLDWNPILHAVELTRYALYTEYGSQGVSLTYLAQCTLIALFLSLACYQLAWKRILAG